MQKTALRLPQDLHQQIIASAHLSGRSMNAEIVARLQATFSGGFEEFRQASSENINSFAQSDSLTKAQRQEVLEIVRTELERQHSQ